jgi:hypothetical protein
MNNEIEALNSCKNLFLRELIEPGNESIRLIVQAGHENVDAISLEIAGVMFSDCRRVESNQYSPTWEIVWSQYVAYAVRNESFVTKDDSEAFTGDRVRFYSESHFLNYISRSTFATNAFPGPMQHIEVLCENQIIDVVATIQPEILRVR